MYTFVTKLRFTHWLLLAAGLCVVVWPLVAGAQFNPEINYQGKLADSSGSTVADGDYDMTFRLYTTASGGSPVWTETRTGADQVTVTSGLFSVMLGDVSSLSGVDFDQTLYLSVEVDSDGEMTPRKVLGSVPAAFQAEEADNAATVGGVASTSLLRSDQADTLEATESSTLLTVTQNGTGNLLDLYDGASNVFTVLDGGNVGIGTSSPRATLSVFGGMLLEGANRYINFGTATSSAGYGLRDNAGSIEFRNNNGSWTALASTTDALIAAGRIQGNGTAISSFNASVARNAAGDYTISFNTPRTTNDYYVSVAVEEDGADRNFKPYITNQTASSFDIRIGDDDNGSTADVLTDRPFQFTVVDPLGNLTPLAANQFTNLTDTQSSLTANRLIFANSGGTALTDSADLTFDGSLLTVSGDAFITGALRDSSNNAGTNGYVLQTTSTGTQWVATSTLGFASASSSHDAVTLAGENYLSLSGQQITANAIDLGTSNVTGTLDVANGGTGATTFTSSELLLGNGTGALTTIATSSLGLGDGSFLGLSDTPGSYSADRLIFTNSGGSALTDSADLTFDGSSVFLNDRMMHFDSDNTIILGRAGWAGTNAGGGNSIAVGEEALRNVTTGNDNIAIGRRTGRNITTGAANTIIGANFTATDLTTGSHNAFYGGNIAYALQEGGENAIFGSWAANQFRSGSRNTFMGRDVARNLATSSDSVVMGQRAAYGDGGNYEAQRLTIIGREAGHNLTTGADHNVFLGYRSGYNVSSGANNILLGYQAANSLTTGANNIIIGYDVEAPSNTADNQLNIGNLIYGTGIDGTGTTMSSGNIGIGTTSPYATLSVDGDLALTGGLYDSTNSAGTSGMVLQTTGTGTQWVATSTLGIGGGGSSDFVGLSDTQSSLTANRLIFTNSGGSALTDSADLTFDGSTLSLGGSGLSLSGSAANIALGDNWLSGDGDDEGVYVGSGGNVGVATSSLNSNIALLVDGITESNQVNIGDRGMYFNNANNGILIGRTVFSGGSIPNRGMGTGDNNIGIGRDAFTSITSGNNNVGIGRIALSNLTSGGFNTVIGADFAGNSITTGSGNSIYGSRSAFGLSTGSNNSLYGYEAGHQLRGGSTRNTFVGQGAAFNLATSSDSVIIGQGAAQNFGGQYEANRLTIIGTNAGGVITTGADNNILLGYQAANSLTTGANNIIIGYDVEAPSNTADNQLNIGNLLFGTGIDGTGTTLSTGNLGIGTTSPNAKLTVAGDINIDSPTSGLSFMGSRMFYASTTNDSISIGDGAGTDLLETGINNVFIGQEAGNSATSSDSNTFIGYRTGWVNTSGDRNTFVGADVARANTSGNNNAFFGYGAGYENTTGSRNVFLGRDAGSANTSGGDNIFIGFDAGYSNTSAFENTFLGKDAGRLNTVGDSNTFIGAQAGEENVDGEYNTYLGSVAGRYLTDGVTAASSTDYSVFLGYQAEALTANDQNSIVIGYGAEGLGSNTAVLGNDSIVTTALKGDVGIGTTTPSSLLSLERTGLDGDNITGGITQNYEFVNSGTSELVYGNEMTIVNNPSSANAMAGSIIKVEDSTSFANTVRGLEVQADGGTNTQGENTALSGFARTFGVRGVTRGDAGGTFEPAGVYGATQGTTQGNALRGFSDTITTADMMSLLQESSSFSGAGLLMNFGTGGGSYSGNFLDLQANGTTQFSVSATGTVSIAGALLDSSGSAGTAGQILESTATGTQWVTGGGGGASDFVGLSDTQGSLTADRLIFTNSGGSALTDSADLTFDGSTLSLGGSGLSLSGSAANIALGDNWLSGDGDDEGVYVGSGGNVGVATSSLNSNIALLVDGITESNQVNIGDRGMYFNSANNGILIGRSLFPGGSMPNRGMGTGDNNIGIGRDAFSSITSGINNVGIGRIALSNLTSGQYNTVIGADFAGNSITTGSGNSIYGSRSAFGLSTGSNNSLYGNEAGHRLQGDSSSNTLIGEDSGYHLSTSSDSVLVGKSAGVGTSDYSASRLTVLGGDAGASLSTGADDNILLGYRAGDNVTTGASNLIIGYDVDAPSATTDNQLNIGNLIYGTGIDGTGTTMSSGNIGIGNSSPSVLLHVGDSSVTDGDDLLRLEDANSVCDFTADSGTPSCGSDRTLKTDISTIEGELEKVLALEPSYWRWKTEDNNDPLKSGFIAQDVEKVLPELVTESVWVDGSTKKFLNIGGMMPYVVGAIKEMWETITLHDERLAELEDENENLKDRLEALEAAVQSGGTASAGSADTDSGGTDTTAAADTTDNTTDDSSQNEQDGSEAAEEDAAATTTVSAATSTASTTANEEEDSIEEAEAAVGSKDENASTTDEAMETGGDNESAATTTAGEEDAVATTTTDDTATEDEGDTTDSGSEEPVVEDEVVAEVVEEESVVTDEEEVDSAPEEDASTSAPEPEPEDSEAAAVADEPTTEEETN